MRMSCVLQMVLSLYGMMAVLATHTYTNHNTGYGFSFTVGACEFRTKRSVGRSARIRPTDRAPTEIRANLIHA